MSKSRIDLYFLFPLIFGDKPTAGKAYIIISILGGVRKDEIPMYINIMNTNWFVCKKNNTFPRYIWLVLYNSQ